MLIFWIHTRAVKRVIFIICLLLKLTIIICVKNNVFPFVKQELILPQDTVEEVQKELMY
jgi:hypothetical protein